MKLIARIVIFFYEQLFFIGIKKELEEKNKCPNCEKLEGWDLIKNTSVGTLIENL